MDKKYSLKKNNLHIEDIFKEFKIPDIDTSLRYKSKHYYIKDKIDDYLVSQSKKRQIKISEKLVDEIILLKEYLEYLDTDSKTTDSPKYIFLKWLLKDRCVELVDYLYSERPLGFEKVLAVIKYYYKHTIGGVPLGKHLQIECFGWVQKELKRPDVLFALPSLAEQKLEILKELDKMEYEISWYYGFKGKVFAIFE